VEAISAQFIGNTKGKALKGIRESSQGMNPVDRLLKKGRESNGLRKGPGSLYTISLDVESVMTAGWGI
jgi:hypothetical protein